MKECNMEEVSGVSSNFATKKGLNHGIKQDWGRGGGGIDGGILIDIFLC